MTSRNLKRPIPRGNSESAKMNAVNIWMLVSLKLVLGSIFKDYFYSIRFSPWILFECWFFFSNQIMRIKRIIFSVQIVFIFVVVFIQYIIYIIQKNW